MRSNYDSLVRLPGNRRDDAELSPSVREHLDRSAILVRTRRNDGLVDLSHEPLCRVDPAGRFVVSGVERSEGREVIKHVLLGERLGQRSDGIIVGGLDWELGL